ncbi:MAG: alpha/beta hydrolase, partial [Bacteroidia bacterium]
MKTIYLILSALLFLIACQQDHNKTTEKPMPADGFVQATDGLDIHYVQGGSGDTTLVFVHGWCIDGSYFNEVAEGLKGRFRVVQIDLGGHGLSGTERSDWRPEVLAADVAAVVNGLNLKNVMLVGHSMGDVIVTEAAHLLKGKVIALLGIDTFISPAADFSEEEAAGFSNALRTAFPMVVDQFIGGFFPEQADSTIKQTILEDMKKGPDSVCAEVLISLGDYLLQGKFGPRLAALNLPVTTINAVPVQDSLWNLAGVSIRSLPLTGVGH